MRILIVGNIVKDIYLELVDHAERFENDERNIPWIDLAFDSGTLAYGRRTSVFGGAAVTLEVLNNFGFECLIAGRLIKSSRGRDLEFLDHKICDTYRYILTRENHVAYLAPDTRHESTLSAPKDPVDWIYVDRSAFISATFLNDLEKYLEVSPATRIAVFASTRDCGTVSEVEMRKTGDRKGSRIFSAAMQKLIARADLIFSDSQTFDLPTKSPVIKISDHEIRFGQIFEHYELKNSDFTTHLTSFSIIAATVLAELAEKDLKNLHSNKNDELDLKRIFRLARINVEHAKITGTLKKEELESRLDRELHAKNDLRLVAKTLVAKNKGILAADESGGSIHKKFETAGIPDDEEHRRDYRNIFFTTDDLEKYVNGVILFEETAHQLSDDGRNFVDYLTGKGIVPGIKVDKGLEPFKEAGHETENWTKGLDDLEARLKNYHELGARFAKWRAAFEIAPATPTLSSPLDNEKGLIQGLETPSRHAVEKNAEILARYARACQEAKIVPIVEPEVVHDGDYSLETCAKVTGIILDELFKQLDLHGVDLESTILKVNMVLAGKKYHTQSTPTEVGQKTAEVLRAHVPENLAGVVFLSGGQTVEQSTKNLQEVTNNGPFPWPVTFSFARALQGPALDKWQGDNKNSDAARAAFKERLIANSEALAPKS